MDDDYKRCPDCAEHVRAEARRCRFCGYRFDAGRRNAFDLLRRPRSTMRLPALLSEWGTELATGEEVAFFGYCCLDAEDGYLLVTSARVAFFGACGSARLLELPLAEISSAATAGSAWHDRRIELSGRDRQVSLRRFASRRDLDRAAACLSRPLSS